MVLLVIGAFSGFRKGFIMEIVGFLAFIIAVIAGFQLLEWGMEILAGYVNDLGNLLPFLAFLIIFIIILISITLLGKLIKTALHLTPLGIADSFAGAFLGLVKWAFGLSLFIWLISVVGIEVSDQWSEGSRIYPWLAPVAPFVFAKIADFVPFFEELLNSITNLFNK